MTYIYVYIIYIRVYRVIIIIRWQTRRDAFIGSGWQLNGPQTENTIAAVTFAHEYPHKSRRLRARMMRLWCPPPRSRNPVSDGGTVLTTTHDLSFIASATIYYNMVKRHSELPQSVSNKGVCSVYTAVLSPVWYDREIGTSLRLVSIGIRRYLAWRRTARDSWGRKRLYNNVIVSWRSGRRISLGHWKRSDNIIIW